MACQLGLSACQPIIAYQVEERGRSRSRECCPLEEPSSSVASRVVSDSESQTSQRLRAFSLAFLKNLSRRWRKEKNDAIAARVEANKAEVWCCELASFAIPQGTSSKG